jgi:hypothetical protein
MDPPWIASTGALHDSPVSRDTTGRSPTPPDTVPATTELAVDLAAQVGRLVDRLRSSSDVRLARALPTGGTRADAAHALAQRMADHAAALEGGPIRPVPRLHDLAVGDQVAVTGADLVRAVRLAAAGGSAGPGRSGETTPAARARDALAAVRGLRDAL